MTGQILTPPAEKIELSGISWQTYERLSNELNDRRLRLTYNRGKLEIMSPSPEHELYKKVLGRFVETLAEESEISIYPLGSTTLKHRELSGAEPDECFYIQNLNAVKGKTRIDLKCDPAPDLVVEIDIPSSSVNRFQVYGDLGVREIWLFNGREFTIYQLQNQDYIVCNQSLAFPNIPISEIVKFLQKVKTKDDLQLVKEFRNWVRNNIT